MRLVGANVAVTGSYNSAVATLPNCKLLPPVIRTLPSASSVAVWPDRATVMSPVGVKAPVAGSYSSALLRETSTAAGVLRVEHTSTLLPDGTVLIAGGGDSALPYPLIYSFQAHSGAELYDPATARFTPTGSHMVVGRTDRTATLLPDGTVLLAGGWDAGAGGTAELYHPKVLVPSPMLFSLSGDGRGPGAILHAGTHQVVSASNPATAGEALEVYEAGLIDGSVIPPQVAIGGRMAEVLFFGKAPGFAGVNQMNVRVPSGIAPGPSVSVRLNYVGRSSNEVSIGVQ